MSTFRVGLLEVGAGRHVQVGRRPPQVAQLDAVPARELAQLLVVGEELVQAVLDVQAARDRAPQQLAPRGREAAARGGDADERRRRARRRARRRSSRRSGRRPASPPPASSRGSRRPAARRRRARRGRLAVVRVAGEALGEDQQPLRRLDTESRPVGGAPGRRRRTRRPATGRRRSAGCRRGRRGRRAARRRSRRDPEARLDHAAEHDAEPERAGGVRHPDRLADPARLRQLDVDPVRDLRAGGDVVEPVAVLVDVDRDRRALLQRPAALVAGAERLLAVLDAELGQLRQRLERLVERPPLVDVDLERQLGGRGRRGRARRRARRRRRA